jgi:hypothetical protein
VRTGAGASFAVAGVTLLRDRNPRNTITARMTKTAEHPTLKARVPASCALMYQYRARRPPPPSALHRRYLSAGLRPKLRQGSGPVITRR